MQDNSIVLVGDRFADFASLDGAMSVSELELLLDCYPSTARLLPREIVIGQGVSEVAVSYLRRRLDAMGLGDVIRSSAWSRPYRAGRSLSHKHNAENVLVTEPLRKTDNVFELGLTIDERCEVMADHVTGCHIQGMLLMEAARQSFLAVTEKYRLEHGRSYYFVINDFSTEFKAFAFPVDMSISLELTDHPRERSDRSTYTALITISQLGRPVTVVRTTYTAFEKSSLSEREQSLARRALRQWSERSSDMPAPIASLARSMPQPGALRI